MSGFKKAVRTQRPLRMAIYGPSNSGKTFTSLMIARELAGPDGMVALIDTERSSASIYAKDPKTGKGFEFDTQSLTDYAYTDYIALIEQAGEYDMLIIDSISHAWDGEGGILDIVDDVTASQKGKPDSFRAWASPKVKAAEAALWKAVLGFPGHVIVTMRAKTVYERSKDERGNTRIEKLGLGPIQRGGIEFEFDVIAEMDKQHYFEIVKARDPERKLDDLRIHEPGVEFAQTLKDWLDSGSTPAEDYGKRIGAICVRISEEMGESLADVKQKAWKWIRIHHETEDLSKIHAEDLAQIPEQLWETYGPGTPEEQRQVRMGEREEGQADCRAQLREVVDRNGGLDADYIWSEICNRSKGDEPTDKEVVYFTNHIDKHPDLWQKPKAAVAEER